MSKAVDVMIHHVENLRRVHEREHAELEEARYIMYSFFSTLIMLITIYII